MARQAPKYNTNLTIHHCAFDSRFCDNCRQAKGKTKYFIGNPQQSVHKDVYCEDCIRNLVAHIPAEFIDGMPNAEELEQKLRAEITVEYDAKLAELVADADARASVKIVNELAAKGMLKQPGEPDDNPEKLELPFDPGDPIDGEEVEDDAPEEEEAQEEPAVDAGPMIFRCLDCGKEFDTNQKLASHKRVHKDQ